MWTPELGVHSLVLDEAVKLAGQDPDLHRKDLMEAIASRCYPKWDFGIQVLSEAGQHKFDFDILNATKLWPEDLVPVRYIGELCLNRNVDKFFAETEQAAFCTSHVIPGVGFPMIPSSRVVTFPISTLSSLVSASAESRQIPRISCPEISNS